MEYNNDSPQCGNSHYHSMSGQACPGGGKAQM